MAFGASGPAIVDVIPRPKGDVTLRGSATTTSDFAVVGDCKRVIDQGKTFEIAKIALSCDEDIVGKITFGGEDISIEYKVVGRVPITDWFPKDDKVCVGDGTKELRVEGKYPSGGAAGDLHAELVGEEHE